MTTRTASHTLPDADLSALRVPRALRADVAQILTLTDGFCLQHLDGEYADLCRQLLAALARTSFCSSAQGEQVLGWALGR